MTSNGAIAEPQGVRFVEPEAAAQRPPTAVGMAPPPLRLR